MRPLFPPSLLLFVGAATERLDVRAVKVFDVLYVKGKNGEGQALIGKSLWQRKKLLGELIKHKQGVIEIAECTSGSTTADIRRVLERIMDERCVPPSLSLFPPALPLETLSRHG